LSPAPSTASVPYTTLFRSIGIAHDSFVYSTPAGHQTAVVPGFDDGALFHIMNLIEFIQPPEIMCADVDCIPLHDPVPDDLFQPVIETCGRFVHDPPFPIFRHHADEMKSLLFTACKPACMGDHRLRCIICHL